MSTQRQLVLAVVPGLWGRPVLREELVLAEA
jgi:hypothetical protein